MSVAFYVLGLWLVAALALGRLLGWACGLNKLSEDGHEWPGDGRS
jgi:hypothetical protein